MGSLWELGCPVCLSIMLSLQNHILAFSVEVSNDQPHLVGAEKVQLDSIANAIFK